MPGLFFPFESPSCLQPSACLLYLPATPQPGPSPLLAPPHYPAPLLGPRLWQPGPRHHFETGAPCRWRTQSPPLLASPLPTPPPGKLPRTQPSKAGQLDSPPILGLPLRGGTGTGQLQFPRRPLGAARQLRSFPAPGGPVPGRSSPGPYGSLPLPAKGPPSFTIRETATQRAEVILLGVSIAESHLHRGTLELRGQADCLGPTEEWGVAGGILAKPWKDPSKPLPSISVRFPEGLPIHRCAGKICSK